MTSREIVRRTIDYDNPERVARSFRNSDICGAGCSAATHATKWQDYACDEFTLAQVIGDR